MTNVELYEALKGSIPEKAARLIAEAFPHARELATRSDVAESRADTKNDIAELRADTMSAIAELHVLFARLQTAMAQLRGELRTEIHASAQRTMRWMLGFFIPAWLGTWATVVAVVLKG